MSVNVKALKGIGEAVVFTIKKGEVLVVEGGFPDLSFFELSSVNLPGGDVIGFPEPRRFVPTFDSTKSHNEWILHWSNKDESTEDRVVVKAHVIKDNDTINIGGEGFESVEIRVWEYEPTEPTEEAPAATEE